MRSTTLLTWFCSAVAAALVVIVAPGLTPRVLGAVQASPTAPAACAWAEATVADDNQGAPDSAAAYWLTPFTAQAGMRIVLAGRYPDARYASIEVTKPGGGLFTLNGVTSELTDYRIAPAAGSSNPWRPSARHPGRRTAGRFTVTVQADVAPGQVNTLPLAPAGPTAGTSYLVYRVYLPADGDFSGVPLPAVTVTGGGGVSERLPDCPPPAATAAAMAAPAATDPGGSVEFARPPAGSGTGLSPNADTGYLAAAVTPPGHGDVVVIRGKAPTASRGSHPSPWPAPGIETRYWSMCVYLATPQTPLVDNDLPGGRIDYGCRHDSQTALDRGGYYTYVVGTEAQRSVIDRIPGATFLPFSSTATATTHILLLRNMLVAADFAQAIQNVPPNGIPASAAKVMGAYYPRAAICPLATLTRDGPGACLAGPPEPLSRGR